MDAFDPIQKLVDDATLQVPHNFDFALFPAISVGTKGHRCFVGQSLEGKTMVLE